eukprot:s4012_g5.t1
MDSAIVVGVVHINALCSNFAWEEENRQDSGSGGWSTGQDLWLVSFWERTRDRRFQAMALPSVNEAQRLVDELLLAAVKSHTVQVSRLGQTLLFEAAQHVSGQQALEISQFLIKNGVSATAADIRQQHACELLITKGCRVSHSDTAQQSPIFYSVRNGHIGATEVLLKHGADINARDQHGFTPIFWAAEAGKVQVMTLGLRQESSYFVAGGTTNLLSDFGGDILTSATGPAVKYAFEELHGDPNRMLLKGQTNLFGAAKRGDLEKLKAGRIWADAERKQQKAIQEAQKKQRRRRRANAFALLFDAKAQKKAED